MSETILKTASRLGVVLVLLAATMAALTATPAEAQLPVYKVEGVVYSPHYKPLPGASVNLHTMAGDKAATGTTDASGKYSLTNVQSGNYNLSVSDACCRAMWIPIQISGTDPVVQQNVVLQSNTGQGALVLRGIVKDERSGKALPDVRLEVYAYPIYEEGKPYPVYRESQQSGISAADGSYAFNLDASQVSINAFLEGYDRLHANFPLSADRTLDLPMRATSGAVVTISGTIKSSDGKPIPNAWVNVQPDYECQGDVCAMPVSEPRAASEGGSGDVQFWYEPTNSPYQSASTDALGKYTLQTVPGQLLLTAHAENHLENRSKFSAKDGEKKTVNLVLEKMPADSVKVHGKVVDAQSGKGIPHAQVHLENQRWGHWNYTTTNDDGSFEFYTKPGYTLVTATAERYYWIPCEASDAKSSGDRIAPEPYGCADGGQRTRDQDYYSRILIIDADPTSGAALDFELEPRPAPMAELKGYVVNQSSQKAIPGVQVNFYNEFTRDWGTATTGDDGSFKIQVHGGYYTIRAWAEHYFDGVMNVELADGESKRVDVLLTPGEKRYGGGCCYYAHAEASGSVSYDSGMGASAPKAAGAPAMETMSASGDSSGASGQESYKGEAGGLGPYTPFSGEPSGGNKTAPGAGIGVLLGSLVAIAALRRRSH